MSTMSDIPHWPREFTIDFIAMYKSHPCLWRVKDKKYTDKRSKDAAYQDLVNLCKSIEPTANRDFVVKKIQSLRGSFRKELKKVLKSKRNGGASADDVYQPKLWYYKQLSFTRNQETTQDGVSTVDQEADDDDDHLSSADDTGIQIQLTESLATPTETRRRATYYDEQPRKLKRSLVTTERNDDLHKPNSISYKDVNEFDAVGISIAAKLKRMDSTQAIYAEMLINKTVCRGLLRTLTANTDIHEICWNPTTAPIASPTNSNSCDK